jgi:vacuolar protein sorting-associated protein 26
MNASGELEVKSPLCAYEASQDVGGVVTLNLSPGKKVEHLGIKIQFIGRIDMVRRDILLKANIGNCSCASF